MAILPFKKLSEGKASPNNPANRINKKHIKNPKKEKEVIENARKEFKKVNIDTKKLLKESRDLKDIKKIEKLVKKYLDEIERYIKSLRDLYGANLNRVYPEIIRLEELIKRLRKILEEIRKKGPSMNLERELHIILNEIHKLWEMHMHKISKT